ncbi:MAG: hypothetical protein R3D27_01115 [Hyphomicrobiaceae bacterium]
MLTADFDTIQPERLPADAPIVLIQRPSRLTLLGLTLGLLAVTPVLLMPFWLVAARAVSNPGMMAAIADQPAAAVQLGLAFLVIAALAGFALRRLLSIAGRRREVCVEGGVVTVIDDRFGHQTRWQQPVAAYCGLARTLRTNVAGIRHQIVLVHPDSQRNIILASATRPDGECFAALARNLGLPEVSDRLIAAGARAAPVEPDLTAVGAGRLAA